MKPALTTRNFNIFANVCIYLSMIGSVISLYMDLVFFVWVFLSLGILFLMIRTASLILEKLGRMNYDR